MRALYLIANVFFSSQTSLCVGAIQQTELLLNTESIYVDEAYVIHVTINKLRCKTQ